MLPKALRPVWDGARGWTLAWGALLIIQGVLPAATVYLSRGMVNALVARDVHSIILFGRTTLTS